MEGIKNAVKSVIPGQHPTTATTATATNPGADPLAASGGYGANDPHGLHGTTGMAGAHAGHQAPGMHQGGVKGAVHKAEAAVQRGIAKVEGRDTMPGQQQPYATAAGGHHHGGAGAAGYGTTGMTRPGENPVERGVHKVEAAAQHGMDKMRGTDPVTGEHHHGIGGGMGPQAGQHHGHQGGVLHQGAVVGHSHDTTYGNQGAGLAGAGTGYGGGANTTAAPGVHKENPVTAAVHKVVDKVRGHGSSTTTAHGAADPMQPGVTATPHQGTAPTSGYAGQQRI